MRQLVWVGVLLVGLGIVGLVVQNVNFTESKKIVDIGPLQVTAEEKHDVPIPAIASIAAIVAGLGIVIAARRRS